LSRTRESLYLLASWALAALSLRRATDANITGWAAVYAVAPLIQLPVVLLLGVLPTRPPAEAAGPAERRLRGHGAAAAQGIVAGIAATLAAVGLGTLLFGTYGYGLFVVAPLITGAIAAYVGNRGPEGVHRQADQLFGKADLGGVLAVQHPAGDRFVLGDDFGLGEALRRQQASSAPLRRPRRRCSTDSLNWLRLDDKRDGDYVSLDAGCTEAYPEAAL
jgi:hypothetical protein